MSETTPEKWALVTGASSGLGVDISREIATRGYNLILVARREDRLRSVAEELRERFSIEVAVEVCDLAQPDAARGLYQRIINAGRVVDVLVNNAGFAAHGSFLEQELDRLDAMLQVNVRSLLELTHLFGQEMAVRGGGWILQVASVVGLVPTPSHSVYSGTKAFVVHFSSSVSWELQDRGVRICALCPGVTYTEFFDVAGQTPTFYTRVAGMKSADVARIGVRALFAKRSRVIAGWRNWLTVYAVKLIPHRVVGWFTWRLMGRR
jgi:uncharacterized protein